MPVREILAKTVAFGLVTAGFIAGGVLVLSGPHSSNEIPPAWMLGWGLIGLGALSAGIGTVSIALIVYGEKLRREAEAIHLTPRGGPPAVPPPWGMADIGRPGVIEVGRDVPSGGGTVRMMSVRTSNLDAPILIGILIVWTIVALLLLAPNIPAPK